MTRVRIGSIAVFFVSVASVGSAPASDGLENYAVLYKKQPYMMNFAIPISGEKAPAHLPHSLAAAPAPPSVAPPQGYAAGGAAPMTPSPAPPPAPAQTEQGASMAREWISVNAEFVNALVKDDKGALLECAWLTIKPEDEKQLEPLKSLHLPIATASPALADMLKHESNLLSGSCTPYETNLSAGQQDMVREGRGDDLAATIGSHKAVVNIMDRGGTTVLLELKVDVIDDPAREVRLVPPVAPLPVPR